MTPSAHPRVRSMAAAAVFVAAGCANGPSGAPTRSAAKRQPNEVPGTDIVKVVPIFGPAPWASFDAAGDVNPEGLTFTLYLVSGKTRKGALTDGTLHAQMYVVQPAAEGKRTRRLVTEWQRSTRELARSTEPSMLGWGYVPMLHWGDADVYGQEIELVIWFSGGPNHSIRAPTKHLKVLSRRDY